MSSDCVWPTKMEVFAIEKTSTSWIRIQWFCVRKCYKYTIGLSFNQFMSRCISSFCCNSWATNLPYVNILWQNWLKKIRCIKTVNDYTQKHVNLSSSLDEWFSLSVRHAKISSYIDLKLLEKYKLRSTKSLLI